MTAVIQKTAEKDFTNFNLQLEQQRLQWYN